MGIKIKRHALSVMQNGSKIDIDTFKSNDGGIDYEALDKKADRIIVSAETEKGTIRDSSEKSLVDLKILGKSEQKRRFGYNLMYFDESEWVVVDGNNVEYKFVGNNALTITSKVTKTSTCQAWAKSPSYSGVDIAGKTLKISCDYSYNTTSSLVYWGLFLEVKNENGVTIQSPGWGFDRSKNHFEMNFTISADAYSCTYLFRLWNVSDSNRFEIGDSVSVYNARMTLDENLAPYEIVSATNPLITVGNGTVEITETLRSVGDVRDEIDMNAMTFIRRISPSIDNEVNALKDDFSEYILNIPTIETISMPLYNSLKSLRTEYGNTELDGGGSVLNIDYVADTKLYIDGNSAVDYSTPEQFGASGDGVTNDTEAFLTAINSGSSVVKLGNSKVYLLDLINIGDADEVEIIGNGSTLLFNTYGMTGSGSDNNTIAFSTGDADGKKSFTMRDIVIDVNARSVEVGSQIGGSVLQGLRIIGYTDVILENVSVTDTLTGIGFEIRDSKTTIIKNCHLHDLGHIDYPQIVFPNYNFGGLEILFSSEESYRNSRVLIDGCVFERIASSCVRAESNYVTIRNCYVADVHSQFCEGGKVLYGNKYYELSNNTFVRVASVIFSSSVRTDEIVERKNNVVVIKNNCAYEIGGGTNLVESHGDMAVPKTIVINDNNNLQSSYDKIIIDGNTFSYAENEITRVGNVYAFANEECIIKGNTFLRWKKDAIQCGTLYENGRCVIENNICNGIPSTTQMISISGRGELVDVNNNAAPYLIDGRYNTGCHFYIRNNITDKYFVEAQYPNVVEVGNLPYSFEL